MKTLIIVRPPVVANPRFQFDREVSLAEKVKEYWKYLSEGVTQCISGEENEFVSITHRIRDVLGLRHPLFRKEILDLEYRSPQIQEHIFYLLEDQLKACDTLVVVASPEAAHYCLDYVKVEFGGDVRDNYIRSGEALLCMKGLGSTKIIPSYRPQLRLVS